MFPCLCRLLVAQLGLLVLVLGQDDLPTCLDSFDIHQDKIIRTQDSRAMGAKYINERDLSSREDCLRLCCETQDCDVFVFEEKTPGSCYLFQCGTPEDFKCKFTKHKNYTSAVLVLNRHMTELESQIKHTQHEHELAKLRQPEIEAPVVSVTVSEAPTTIASGNKEVIQVIPTSPPVSQSRRCSRYQFECRGSGECIAIYNACDGIPQCADGSDEAPELGCPAQVSTLLPAIKAVEPPQPQLNLPSNGNSDSNSGSNRQGYQLPSALSSDNMPVLPSAKQYHSNQWTPQMFENQQHLNAASAGVGTYLQAGSGALPQSPMSPQQSPPQLVQQAKQFGREGEALLYHPPNELLQWAPPPPPPSMYQQDQSLMGYRTGGSQIFSHKGSGLMTQTDSMGNQFESMQPDYTHYNNYYENAPFHKPPQAPNGWQSLHKPHAEMGNMAGVEENMNTGVVAPNNLAGQDYYYEESFRSRLPQPQRLSPEANKRLSPDVKPSGHKGEVEMEVQQVVADADSKAAAANTSVKKATVHHESTTNTTDKPKEAHHHIDHHNSHRRVETLSAELSLSENSYDSDDGQNVNPRGAILSLTMGLCVTGIMLVLVGCRMRMVRRRMRRGSKSPYAHDADFLVNGMYL